MKFMNIFATLALLMSGIGQQAHAQDSETAHLRGELEAMLVSDQAQRVNMRAVAYGTQLITDPTTGKNSFRPIADEIDVDKRRAAVGLQPLAEYAKRFGVIYERPKP